MSACEACGLEDKLLLCCGRHPMTGEQSRLEMSDGRVISACPGLSSGGLCAKYQDRPIGCREFFCNDRFTRTW